MKAASSPASPAPNAANLAATTNGNMQVTECLVGVSVLGDSLVFWVTVC